MQDDSKNIAESVRSGRYFAEARGWYQAIYLSPVGGRTLFLIIAVLASLVGLCALSALSSLLPLSSRPAMIIYAVPDKMDEVIPRLVPLNKVGNDSSESVNKFLIQVFVTSSETVDSETMSSNASYLKSHANETISTTLLKRLESLQTALGDGTKRRVKILSMDVDNDKSKGTGRAVVRFTAYTEGTKTPSKTEWTAKLDYKYTALGIKTVVDEKTSEEKMTITDPEFQVIGYVADEVR